ncbi:MAG TPA: hypothetical protein VGR95_05410 [Thermoanaerobaculia bacterium]|nr:hypothetical protein [Thermoanaerobaculia bacterium]
MLTLAVLLTIQQTLQSLRAVQVGEDDTIVPPAARTLLRTAKDELREAAVASLRNQPADATAAAASLREVLRPEVAETPYGGLTTEVTTHGDAIALLASFDIPCGNDAALFLFRHDGRAWKLVLDRERNDYDTIAGAAGSLAFAVSSPDAKGSLLVISIDINPWCTSAWQTIRWRVDRADRDHSSLVTQQRDTIYLGDDDLEIAVRPHGFSLEYSTHSADLGRLSYKRLLHYAVDSENHLMRIEPTARTAVDAVDEWLRQRHDHPFGEYEEPVRLPQGKWRVKLVMDDGSKRTFMVREKKGEFRVLTETRCC